MSLINREALLSFEKIDADLCATCGEHHTAEDVIMMIKTAPTIDAIPVVRCKDCKQGEVDDPDFPDEYYCHAGCGWNNGDFYCAYGERKN